MPTVTVASLISQVRKLSDLVGAEKRITDSDIITYIDKSWKELQDLLIEKEQDYFITTSGIDLVAGTDTYALPTNFYRLRGVDIVKGSDLFNVRKFNWQDRNRFQRTDFSYNYYEGNTIRYRLQGNSLKITPTPTKSDTLQVNYVPSPPTLTSSTDTIEDYNGWSFLVVCLSARLCLIQETTSTSSIDVEIARQLKRIDDMAGGRDSAAESASEFQRWYLDGY